MRGESLAYQERIDAMINGLHIGDATELLRELPDHSIDLVVTSPPYWTAVTYDQESAQSTGSYECYIEALLKVWKECERVLRPNGKMAINTPIMPIPKEIISDQHTRHIKNINNDIETSILSQTGLLRFSLYIWQKQTSKLMFGSYPYPGNILENNTVEFINVFVKPGKPPKYDERVKEANKLTREEWIDLTQQIWFMYPEDVKRENDHPAPFPLKLPARLISMYTFGETGDFKGDIVLDPFCGTGTTCLAARMLGRRFIGIDISQQYIEYARNRIFSPREEGMLLLVGRAKYPSKEELIEMQLNTAGHIAGKKHKRETYGRKIEVVSSKHEELSPSS